MNGSIDSSLPLAIGPLSVASVAHQRHPTVYLTAAKVAERFRIPYIHNLRSSLSMEALASSASPHMERWLELFPFKSEAILRSFVSHAKRYNFSAILLTLDESTSSPPSIISEKIPGDQRLYSPDLETQPTYSKMLLEEPSRLVSVMKVLRSHTNIPIVLNVSMEQQTVLYDALLAVRADAVCLTIDQYTLFRDFIDAINTLQRHTLYSENIYAGGSCFTEQEVVQLIAHGVRRVLIDQPIVWGLLIDGFDGISNVIDIYRKSLSKIH